MDFQKFLDKDKPPTNTGELFIKIVGARKLVKGLLGKPDPFAEIKIMKGDKKIIKTKTVESTITPIWNFSDVFNLDLPDDAWSNLKIVANVWNYNYVSNSLLGQIEIDVSPIYIKLGEEKP